MASAEQVQPSARRQMVSVIRWDGASQPDQSSSDPSTGLSKHWQPQDVTTAASCSGRSSRRYDTNTCAHHVYKVLRWNKTKQEKKKKRRPESSTVIQWHPVVGRWFILLAEEGRERRALLQMVTAHHRHWSLHSSCFPLSHSTLALDVCVRFGGCGCVCVFCWWPKALWFYRHINKMFIHFGAY